MIDEALDEYIALHYRTKVKPLLNHTDSKGKKVYTPATATAYVKKELQQMYLKR
jgi:hypothetical protein